MHCALSVMPEAGRTLYVADALISGEMYSPETYPAAGVPCCCCPWPAALLAMLGAFELLLDAVEVLLGTDSPVLLLGTAVVLVPCPCGSPLPVCLVVLTGGAFAAGGDLTGGNRRGGDKAGGMAAGWGWGWGAGWGAGCGWGWGWGAGWGWGWG